MEAEDELQTYLRMPAARHDVEVLDFWRAQKTRLPNLVLMCRQFHALPATSGGVERLFSKTGRMHDDLKKATKEKTLHHAMWAGYAPP